MMKIKNPRLILGILSGLNLVNYLDRILVAAVGPKLREELGLSGVEFAVVLNGFMVGYFVTSPIFGALGDRFRRRELIALGVAAWSLATAASGMMRTFLAMVGMRVIVGVGEASYATLAPTIIDDLAAPSAKNRWLSVFYVAIPVGSALGYQLGGYFEHLYGWRSVFFIAGVPGLALALLTLTIEEPARVVRKKDTARGVTGTWSDWKKLFSIGLYRSAVIGYIAQTFVVGGFAGWAPSYLYEHLHMDLEAANFWFGLILVVTGLLATFVGGQLGDRWPGENRARANLRVCAVTTLIAVPFTAACFLANSPVGFFAGIAVAEFGIFMATSPINVVILQGVPVELRASAMALSIFAIHLLGDFISPLLIGVISDAWTLQKAMFVLPIGLAIAAWAWWTGSSARSEIELAPPRG